MQLVPRMAFVLLLDFGVVANAANFTLFLTFMVVIAALIVLKYRLLRAKRPLLSSAGDGQNALDPSALGIVFNAFMLAQLSFQILLLGSCLACW